ncbi:MAG TPA: DUF92 domain-containing protein [Candidatus Baltobacteraceae bacterium]|nr:DUF92 domain-containing protein [Candidatus Baltobacteraceae bacterium]
MTWDGALAAFVVGTLIYGSGGIGFTIVLLAFFVPSIALSRVGRARKRALDTVAKGGARDAWQVAANGGIAALAAVAWAQRPYVAEAAAFAGALAAANADTWATEIGTLARRPPRSILTFRRLETGLSGGVSLPGTLAEIAGALWIGLVALAGALLAYRFMVAPYLTPDPGPLAPLLLAVPAGGVAGATVDSLLGATVQELRWCPVCERACESDPHACGTPTTLHRGVRGVSNDVVNVLATLAGAAVAFALA